jgi:hypothetical protein
MKTGDLVKMKYIAFWMKKNHSARVAYTETPLLVYESVQNAIRVILPDGRIKSDLKEYYEIISKA